MVKVKIHLINKIFQFYAYYVYLRLDFYAYYVYNVINGGDTYQSTRNDKKAVR